MFTSAVLIPGMLVWFAMDDVNKVSAFDKAVRIDGQFEKVVSGKDTLARTSWSGTEYTLAFEGSKVSINLKSPANVFGVVIDGKEFPPLDLSTNSDELHLLAEKLEKGLHIVSVAKRTESSQGDDIFKGFEIVGVPKADALPPPPKLKIEFFGNSITAGYGVLDSVKEHDYAPITEDVFSSYAGVAAKELHAQMRTVAFSGRGIFINHPDSKDDRPLPAFFDKLGVNTTADTADLSSNWQPDIAIIELGTNDFSRSVAPDSAKFVNAVIDFAKAIRKKYADANIVILDGPMLNDFYPEGVPSLSLCRKFLDAAKSELENRGFKKIHRFSLSPQDGSLGYGANWHPSKSQSLKNGKELAEFLRTVTRVQ
ncbi:lipase [Fibrobacterales bacterium]|nr:lipase [Fibrobacterales bacterium]